MLNGKAMSILFTAGLMKKTLHKLRKFRKPKKYEN